MVHKEDNRSLTLIDYEYTGWCTRATDLANFVNECAIDNAHPGGFGVKIYHENMMSDAERLSFLTEYLRLSYEHADDGETRTWDAYVAQELPPLDLEVKRMCLMTSFQWAVWALKMLNESEVCNEEVYNIWYAQERVRFYLKQKEVWSM